MHDVVPPPQARRRPHLVNTAVIVAVLGVLPFVAHTSEVWRVLGPALSGALVVRTLRLLWRDAFSTGSRHLGTAG
ncbi:MAG TPA: hypothetical protein VGN47_06855 [Blastococcus sp.]|jgi:hypothetical protein|nr:hypothetical protein [Blastococcus sp.]